MVLGFDEFFPTRSEIRAAETGPVFDTTGNGGIGLLDNGQPVRAGAPAGDDILKVPSLKSFGYSSLWDINQREPNPGGVQM
jgi:hypothetical protein